MFGKSAQVILAYAGVVVAAIILLVSSILRYMEAGDNFRDSAFANLVGWCVMVVGLFTFAVASIME